MDLEALVERVIAIVPRAELGRAREAFHGRTGAFEPGEPFYEERIRAFFDWLAVEHEAGAAARGAIARRPLAEPDRALLRALGTSMRSLWRVADATRDGNPVLLCMLGGARFAVAREGIAARLDPGDVLDGRLVAVEGRVLLAPGPVFHPREAHDALALVIAEARAAGRGTRDLLDALLRMRMRFDRFTSIHARHVYRADALDRMEILAAPWHR